VRGADLHMAQLMPLPLTVSCSCKIQIGFTFLVPAHLGSPEQRDIKRMCVCVCASPSRISSLNLCQGKVVSGKCPVGERPVTTSAVCSCRRVDLSLSVRVCMCVN